MGCRAAMAPTRWLYAEVYFPAFRHMTMPATDLRERLSELDFEVLLLEPPSFDKAFIGLANRFGFPTPVACYDVEKLLAILQEDGLSAEDAQEYFEVNIEGAWLGEGTPIFLSTLSSILGAA